MALNSEMAFILRYFTEFGSGPYFALRRLWPLRVRCRRKTFTFAISSCDEFLFELLYTFSRTLNAHCHGLRAGPAVASVLRMARSTPQLAPHAGTCFVVNTE